MVILRQVVPSMFPEIYPLLAEFDSRYLQEADWKGIIAYSWRPGENYCGYVLFDSLRPHPFLPPQLASKEVVCYSGDLVGILQSGAYARGASPLDFLSHPQLLELLIEGGRAATCAP